MIPPSIMGSLVLAIGEYEVLLIPYLVLVVISITAVLPMVLFRKWYFYRRQLKSNIITSDYEPPAGLMPAEVQYLFGGIHNERVTAATIIHLVQRGYLHMRKDGGKKLIFAGPREPDELKIWEQMIIAQADNKNGVEVSIVLKNPIAFVDKDITDAHSNASTLSDYIAESLQRRRLIRGKSVNQFFIDSLVVAVFIIACVIWWPILLFWIMSVLEATSSSFSYVYDFLIVAAVVTVLAFVPILFISVFIVKWRAQLIGRRWMSTNRLSHLWPQMMGFRHFVKLTEKGRLKFDSKELEKSSSKDILPYAVALGFVDNWQDIVL